MSVVIGRGVDPDSKDKAAPAGYDGRIDELLIFQRALAPDEIRTVAQAGKASVADTDSVRDTATGGH